MEYANAFAIVLLPLPFVAYLIFNLFGAICRVPLSILLQLEIMISIFDLIGSGLRLNDSS